MSFGIRYSSLASGILLVLNFGIAMLLNMGAEAFAFSPAFIAAILGAIGALCFRAKFSLAKTTVLLSFTAGLCVILPLFLLNQFFVPNFLSNMNKELLSTLYQVINDMGKSAKLDVASVEQLKSQYLEIIENILPAIGIVFCAFIAFVFPFLSRSYCRKRGRTDFEYMTPFISVKADKLSAIVFMITVVMAFLTTDQLMVVFLNLVLICGAGMMICGFSVIAFYLQTRIKKWSVRLLLYIVILFIPSALFLLVLLGIIDAFADLRHIKDRGDMLE